MENEFVVNRGNYELTAHFNVEGLLNGDELRTRLVSRYIRDDGFEIVNSYRKGPEDFDASIKYQGKVLDIDLVFKILTQKLAHMKEVLDDLEIGMQLNVVAPVELDIDEIDVESK